MTTFAPFRPRNQVLHRECLSSSTDAIAFARDRLGFLPDPQQQRVLSPGVNRGLLNCTRQWGKSTVIAIKAVHHALTQPNRLVVVCSPSWRQSHEFCRKVLGFLNQLGIKSLDLPNGSRIVGLPANENTIRGFSACTLLLIDEAARVSDGLYAAAKPMLATTNGELWLMSTPHGAKGFFYHEWMDAAATWERVCVTAAECPRIIPKFLQEEKRSLGELRFRQEYCCEFLEDGRAVFPTAWIDTAFAHWPHANQRRLKAQFAVCVDLGQMTNPTAIAVLETWQEPTGEINRTTWERPTAKAPRHPLARKSPLRHQLCRRRRQHLPTSPPVEAVRRLRCSPGRHRSRRCRPRHAQTRRLVPLPPHPRHLHLRRTRHLPH